MKRLGLFACAAAALCFAACVQVPDSVGDTKGKEITLRAYQEGAMDSKTTVKNGGTQILWEPGDEINVFFKGEGARFVSQNRSNAAVADFSGSLNALLGANEGEAFEQNAIWGLYPYDAEATSDGQSVTTTLPAEQTGRAGSFAKNTHITLACQHSYDLAFYNVCGGVRFSVTRDDVVAVTLQGNDGESLSGQIRLEFENGLPVVRKVTNGGTQIILYSGDKPFEPNKWYYMEALPGVLSKGYKMTFYSYNTAKGSKEYATRSLSSSVQLRRGVVESMEKADAGVQFKTLDTEPAPFDPYKKIVYNSLKTWAQEFVKYLDVWENNVADVLDADPARYTGSRFGPWTNVHFIPIPQDTPYENWESLIGKNQWDPKYQPYYTVKLGDAEYSAAQCWEIGIRGLMDMCTKEGNTFIDGMKTRNDIPTYQDNKSLMNAPINRPNENCIWGQYPWYEQFQVTDQLTLAGIPVTEVDVEFLLRCGSVHVARAFFNNFAQAIGKIGNFQEFAESEGTINHKDAEGNSYIGLICPMRELLIMARIYKYLLDNDINSNVYTALKDKKFDYELYSQQVNLELDKTSLSLEEGKSVTLVATSDAADKGLVWTSSDESVATVDQNGKVTGVKAGTATITATANDGSGKTASCSVQVYRIDTPSAVDLGLSVKWASFNIGASSAEEYGNYYAWGEIEPKSNYSWSTYKWCKGDYDKLTKYCPSGYPNYWAGSGNPDNKSVLDSEDDVACVKLGGKWRMPTDAEWTELRTECTWTWKSNYNGTGVNGRLVTGPNGNSIFLPAAGHRGGTDLSNVGSRGYYRSSSLNTDGPYYACFVYFLSDGVRWYDGLRYYGLSVRPVFGDWHISSVTLNESSLSLEIGQSYNLIASVSPDYLTWRSSDESIATVDQSGKVTAIKAGSATITATANDGSGVYAECSVDVCKIDGDLGLSVKWATSNLCESGLCANSWDYGDYYAWGETSPKSDYSWGTYKWYKGDYDKLTKYCPSGRTDYWAGSGSPDNKRVLDSEDDVACVKLGGKWRMPTDEEWRELINKCTWTWKSNYNGTGVNGRLVTGPNGNSIFLPAAGFRGVYDLYGVGSSGNYWSSSLDTDDPYGAWNVYFSSDSVYRSSSRNRRYEGQSVRPVS